MWPRFITPIKENLWLTSIFHHHSTYLPDKYWNDYTISALLPLFPDDSKSLTMIHHAMNVITQAVQRENPGQVPVVTVDQPLYSIAKQMQWSWPITYGEDHFVIILEGLHIDMAALKIQLGGWLEGSFRLPVLPLQSCIKSSPLFRHTALQMELLVLSFVRMREDDFSLYVDSMTKLVPCCLDHTNACWLPC